MLLPRTIRLDAAALAQASASPVLALDEGAFGGHVALLDGPPTAQAVAGDGVGVITIDGVLAQRGVEGMCGSVDGYDWLAARFAAAMADPEVHAAKLHMRGPGGDVAGLEEGIRRMVEARDRAGKKVYAIIDESALSAHYWIASAVANGGIFLPIAGAVGSIGCIGALRDETKALEANGIGITLIRDPEGKDEANSYGPLTELAVQRARERVGEASGRFIAAVAAARGLTVEAVRGLNGRVLRGQAAVDGGLANGLASVEQVRAMAAGAADERRRTMSVATKLGLPEGASAAQIEEKVMALAPLAELGAAVATLAGQGASAALGTVSAWKTLAEQAQAKKLVDDAAREKAEAAEKVELYAQQVAAGHRLPAVTWADPVAAAQPGGRVLLPHLAATPIEALRAETAVLVGQPRAVGGGEKKPAVVAALSDREMAQCKAKGIDPAAYAATKRGIAARNARPAGEG